MRIARVFAILIVPIALAACMPGESVRRDFTGSVTCPGLSPIAQDHLNATHDRLARCGPQTVSPY